VRPVSGAFYDLFTEAAQHLVLGAQLLAEMLADGNDREDISRRMREAEHAADETTHALVQQVNRTFVTPFDREDIYALGSGLDDIMDMMDEAVDLTVLYEIDPMPAEFSEQVEVLQRCAELTAEAMPRLRSMKGLEEFWIEINRLENAGDRTHRKTLARLFSGEYKTLDVLKLKDVAESLEGAIDAFEKVANIVEQIVVKEG
jgi:predicted phosphate transport protein (TIGR00153 family)